MTNTKEIKARLSADSGLSPHIRRVFQYRAEGKTEKEIAEILYRSIKTINTQSGTILQELDCHNIQQAIAKASAEGWLTFRYITKNLTILAFVTAMAGQFLFSDTDTRRTRLTQSYRIVARRVTGNHV